MIIRGLEIDRWGDVRFHYEWCPEGGESEVVPAIPLGYIGHGKPSWLPECLEAEWDRLHAEWVEDLGRAADELAGLEWTYRSQQGF